MSCRVRSHLLELQGTHRSTRDAEYTPAGPRGGFYAGLPAVSRILNFPIVNREKSFRTWTWNPTPRAILCIDPGGYVRGAERPGAAAASPLGGPLGTCLGGMSGCGWAPLQAWLRPPGSPRGHGVFESLAFWVFGRESIFKFCHSKSRQNFQNLDLEPDSTRKPLQPTRWVCEGGRESGQGGSSSRAPTVCGLPGVLLGEDVRLRLGTSPGLGVGVRVPSWHRGGCASRFLAVSRFLKFPILNRGKSFRIWTSNPTPRASLCSQPGGYMKGGREARRVGSSSSLSTCPDLCEPLGGDVRLRLGTSPGAATAASPLDSDRDALVQTPTVCRGTRR